MVQSSFSCWNPCCLARWLSRAAKFRMQRKCNPQTSAYLETKAGPLELGKVGSACAHRMVESGVSVIEVCVNAWTDLLTRLKVTLSATKFSVPCMCRIKPFSDSCLVSTP
jgi:hypothetical protein